MKVELDEVREIIKQLIETDQLNETANCCTCGWNTQGFLSELDKLEVKEAKDQPKPKMWLHTYQHPDTGELKLYKKPKDKVYKYIHAREGSLYVLYKHIKTEPWEG